MDDSQGGNFLRGGDRPNAISLGGDVWAGPISHCAISFTDPLWHVQKIDPRAMASFCRESNLEFLIDMDSPPDGYYSPLFLRHGPDPSHVGAGKGSAQPNEDADDAHGGHADPICRPHVVEMFESGRPFRAYHCRQKAGKTRRVLVGDSDCSGTGHGQSQVAMCGKHHDQYALRVSRWGEEAVPGDGVRAGGYRESNPIE